ncbi:tyrosine-type recombinase/integrase [Chelatococcus reniformis]|nr:site-specific integrase [Chelatococcus reniformis]
MTVGAAIARFWDEVGQHYGGTYGKTLDTALDWLLAELGPTTRLRDIGPSKVAEVIAKRRGMEVVTKTTRRKLTNATVNRTVTEPLRRILIRAADMWEQPGLKKIDWSEHLLPEPKERVRELRDHEEAKTFDRMRDDYRPAIAFALVSGFRLAEVANLRWADVDWTAQTIAVIGKGEKAATIPLTSEMRAILAGLRGHHDEFVFTYVCRRGEPGVRVKGRRYPITYEGLKSAWRRHGARAAGVKDFRFHDLRHTTATRLMRERGNIKIVSRVLRHEDIATTSKYAHVHDDDVREAMEAVSAARKPVRKATGTDEGQP